MATIFCQRELEFCCECMAGLVWLTIPIGLSGSSAILNVRSCQNLPLGLPEATGGKRWRIFNGRSLPLSPKLPAAKWEHAAPFTAVPFVVSTPRHGNG